MKKVKLKDVLALPGLPDSLTFDIGDEPSPFAPKVQPYIFREEIVRPVVGWLLAGRQQGEGLWISGPPGAGKTSCFLQVAARLGIGVHMPPVHPGLEFLDLVGCMAIIGGDTVFQPGPLYIAMDRGEVLVMNEFDTVRDPAVGVALHNILDGFPLEVPEQGGTRVPAQPGFGIVVTGNGSRAGDTTGLFRGVQRQNCASLDRYWRVRVDYPDPATEERVLEEAVPQLPAAVRTKLVETAREVRRCSAALSDDPGGLDVTVSTRTLVRWGRLTVLYGSLAKKGISPLYYALELALTADADPATREAIFKMVHAVTGEEPRLQPPAGGPGTGATGTNGKGGGT